MRPKPIQVFSRTAFFICVIICGWSRSQGLEDGLVSRIPAKPAPSPSGKLLEKIDSATIGILFTNSLPRERILENYNFTLGSGVALGDVDGDGLDDILLCAIDGPNRLFRNLGNWHFEDATASLPGNAAFRHSTGAAFADVDGDNDADIILNTLGEGTHVLLNNGEGTFERSASALGFSTRAGATGLAIGDLDGDGDLDIYVSNYGAQAVLRSGGQAQVRRIGDRWEILGPYAHRLRFENGALEEIGEPDELFLNDGTGRFESVSLSPGRFSDDAGRPLPILSDFGLGAQMRDIDGDGAPDIYVCNDFKSPDRIWMNDGTGHFRLSAPTVFRKESYASMGVDFADVDRDGHTDIFVVEMLATKHGRRMRQHSSMQLSMPVPGDHTNRVEVAQNTFFRNRGDGTFAELAYFAGLEASDWSWQPVFLDVDLDGFEDVLIVNGNAFDVQDRDTLAAIEALGRQTATEARASVFRYPRLETPDIAFRNRGDLTFEDFSTSWGFDAHGISQGIALADLDNDGDRDIVINRLDAPPLIYRNNSTAPRVAVRLNGITPNTDGIGATITLLGGAVSAQSQEMISGGRYVSSDSPVLSFAANEESTPMTIQVRWRSGRVSKIENTVADSIYVITEPEIETTSPTITPSHVTHFTDMSVNLRHQHHEEWFADYVRQPLLMKQLSSLGPGLAVTDLDSDGFDDLVIGSGRGGTVQAYRGAGDGSFTPFKSQPNRPAPDDTAGFASWIEADGKPALLMAVARYEDTESLHPNLQIISIADNQMMNVRPSSGEVYDLENSMGPVAVADFDGDADLDVFVGGRVLPGRYPSSPVSQLYRNENGLLVPVQVKDSSTFNPGMVSGAVWSDLHVDGFSELILACEWGPLTIFNNLDGHLQEWDPLVLMPDGAKVSLSSLTGIWTGVTTGDFDSDGRIDIVAGNWGRNSSYRASPTEPERLYYGDIGGRGMMDLFEAAFDRDAGTHVPRRSIAALGQAAPRLRAAFPTHSAFSETSMDTILSVLDARPAHLDVTTLESMVFLNRGEQLQAHPLPAEVQFAPVFGINIADFDGNGSEDLFVAQNFFAMRPELARQDAGTGLWLSGNSDGTFMATTSAFSGTAMRGEQRGSAVGDFNNDFRPDLVVAQNADETKVYENHLGRPGLKVRLRGPTSNPDGIGAVIRIGEGPARLVHGGSGYLSQDSTSQIMYPMDASTTINVTWPGGKTTSHPLTKRTGIEVIHLAE